MRQKDVLIILSSKIIRILFSNPILQEVIPIIINWSSYIYEIIILHEYITKINILLMLGLLIGKYS